MTDKCGKGEKEKRREMTAPGVAPSLRASGKHLP